MSNQAPKFIDLFAGCGGLSLGLETAGFSPMFVNELSPQAMDTYLSNRRAHHPQLDKFNINDVKQLVLEPHRLEDLADGLKREYDVDVARGELDLIAGGPPCQGFSGIGHRRSYSVAREQLPSNHLYQDMAHVIHKLRPKMFLFENVEGLIRGRWTPEGTKGEIWEDVLETFRGIPGYSVRYKLVHARDYHVPQNRPRVLLVGVRDDQPFYTEVEGDAVDVGYLPAPAGAPAPGIEAIWSDLVDPAYQPGGETTAYPSAPMNEWQERFRLDPRTGKILGKGGPVTEHEYSKHSPHVVAKFQHMIDNDGMMLEHMKTKKFAQRVLPREWGPRGATITATSLPDDYVHYSQPRVPTVREWARLQTFPDWYQFKGKRTTGGLRRAGNPRIGLHEREVPKYTQIGNAVPINLAAAVGAHFKALLER